MKSNRAQGTIEYLVILAVIVVIALIVVSLMISSTAPSAGISTTSSKLSDNLGTGSISILEFVTDSEGDSLITMQNLSGDTMVIKKIVDEDGTSNNYNTVLTTGDKKTFNLDLEVSCECFEGEVSKTCKFDIYSESGSGFPKTESLTVQVNCVAETVATDENRVVEQSSINSTCSLLGEGIYTMQNNVGGTLTDQNVFCDSAELMWTPALAGTYTWNYNCPDGGTCSCGPLPCPPCECYNENCNDRMHGGSLYESEENASHYEACLACYNLEYGGFDNWELPTIAVDDALLHASSGIPFFASGNSHSSTSDLGGMTRNLDPYAFVSTPEPYGVPTPMGPKDDSLQVFCTRSED